MGISTKQSRYTIEEGRSITRLPNKLKLSILESTAKCGDVLPLNRIIASIRFASKQAIV